MRDFEDFWNLRIYLESEASVELQSMWVTYWCATVRLTSKNDALASLDMLHTCSESSMMFSYQQLSIQINSTQVPKIRV